MNSLNRRSSLRAVEASELELNIAAAMRSRQDCISNGLKLQTAYCGLKQRQKKQRTREHSHGLQCSPALDFLQ